MSQSFRVESLEESRERLQTHSQLRVRSGSWDRGQFGNPEEEERPSLEAATKRRSGGRDWEH
jgi:hypothetical protein